MAKDGTRAHRVEVSIAGKEIGDFLSYDIISTMVEPADGFQMQRAFDIRAWRLCEPDAEIIVAVDGTVILNGFIDDLSRNAKAGTMEIAGRDRSGRLVQESIPTVNGWDGLSLVEAVKRLAAPWYTKVSLSDARNRSVRRGKGHKASAADEPAYFGVSGKLDEDHAGKFDPGETRWNMIEQLVSSVGLLCWSSADGKELIVGKPNYKQQIQYLFRVSRSKGSTVNDMRYAESVRDSYALIEVHGSGTGDEDDFGENVTSYLGTSKDGPNIDGTGGWFKRPKRLVVTQTALSSNAEAKRAAARERIRRDFRLRHLTVEAPLHGQVITGSTRTLFAPNTLARCIDDDLEMDETWLPYACRYRCGGRNAGETTELMLVPRGVEFVA